MEYSLQLINRYMNIVDIGRHTIIPVHVHVHVDKCKTIYHYDVMGVKVGSKWRKYMETHAPG